LRPAGTSGTAGIAACWDLGDRGTEAGGTEMTAAMAETAARGTSFLETIKHDQARSSTIKHDQVAEFTPNLHVNQTFNFLRVPNWDKRSADRHFAIGLRLFESDCRIVFVGSRIFECNSGIVRPVTFIGRQKVRTRPVFCQFQIKSVHFFISYESTPPFLITHLSLFIHET
jgi:hypothetical protein